MLSRLWILAALFLALGSGVWPAEAAGPWRARVVDAETGQPLEGVVVLAAWFKYTASVGGWAAQKYYASEEVVTGPDGRFQIRARWAFTWLPFFTTVKGPEFSIFKPGYGQWRFRGADEWLKLSPEDRDARVEEAWERFEGKGVIIELPPLKNREERLKFFPWASGWPSDVIPDVRMSRYLEALDQEAVALGFTPTGRGKLGRKE